LRHTVLDLQETGRCYQVFDAGKLDRTDNGIEPTVCDGIAQLLSIKTGYLYGIGQYLERVVRLDAVEIIRQLLNLCDISLVEGLCRCVALWRPLPHGDNTIRSGAEHLVEEVSAGSD
jgi:hypothetical protein